jgi:hypothetical protein
MAFAISDESHSKSARIAGQALSTYRLSPETAKGLVDRLLSFQSSPLNMNFQTLIAVLVFMAGLPSLFAGGSFATEQVLPLLKQNPELYDFVTRNLELESGGWAVRIGSRVNPDLGGARIAPYSIRVRPKGSTGPWQFLLDIEAETVFLDQSGKDVPLEEGKTIKEILTGIRLTPITDPKSRESKGSQ